MKKFIYIACLLSVIALSGQAQKETFNWVFGNYAGLSFHPDSLRSFAATGIDGTDNATFDNLPGTFRSSILTMEGCFSMSDKEGNLLFYSDGSAIWKADGTKIYSELGGSYGSSQSGIVLPYPGDEKKYICIGLHDTNYNSMGYVIVQANSPTDVSVIGNRVAFSGHTGILGECMSAIKHANDTDWWIVAPGKGDPTYINVWLATSSGVAASAPKKIINTGEYLDEFSSNGYFRFTADGNYFVYPTLLGEKLIYGTFNNQTGEFSNIQTISGQKYYGSEFSPSQKYLYLTTAGHTSVTNNGLYIWDFDAMLQGTATTPIKYIESTTLCALQKDCYGRIWGVEMQTRDMLLIDNPDDPENLKTYRLSDFLLSGTNARSGLSSFSASFFNVSIQTDNEEFCVSTEQSYSAKITKGSGTNTLAKTTWDFGDGSTVITDTDMSGTQTHTHTYTKPGKYIITVKSFLTSGSEVINLRKTLEVTVNPCVMPVNPNIHLY